MSLPVLYSFRRCPYAMRARLAIDVGCRPCELREVVLRDKPPAMLEASAKGTVPVLVDVDGRVLDESLDIMLWALALRDPAGWLEPQRGNRGAMLELIERNDGPFKRHLDRYKYASRYPGEDPLAHRAAGAAFLDELEQRLRTDSHLFGARPTLADVAIAPFVRQFAIADRDWFASCDRPGLQAWLADFEASARFARVMTKLTPWREGDPVTVFPAPASAA